MQKFWTLLAVMTALIAVAAVGCKDRSNDSGENSGVTEDTVKLGLFVSTSGGVADYGIATKNGAEMAVAEINAAGGIKGKQIELISYDIATKAEETSTVATKLATQDNVLVAMGAVASSLSQVAAPVFQKHKIPMITPSSTFPPITSVGSYVSRICFTDKFAGRALARFAYVDLGKRKAGIICNQDDPYSTGLTNFFELEFKNLGGEVVSVQKFSNTNKTDFSTQLDNIKAGNPDIVFAPVYYSDIILISQQARGKGIDIPLLGSDGWESPAILKEAASHLNDCYFGNHYSQNDQSEKVQGFIKKFAEKHGDKPTSLAALGYDVVYFVKQAIENADSFDREKISEAINNMKGFKGVTGNFDIDKNRNAHKAITMLKITGGKLEYVRQIKPSEIE